MSVKGFKLWYPYLATGGEMQMIQLTILVNLCVAVVIFVLSPFFFRVIFYLSAEGEDLVLYYLIFKITNYVCQESIQDTVLLNRNIWITQLIDMEVTIQKKNTKILYF
jgi:hypothetical protein